MLEPRRSIFKSRGRLCKAHCIRASEDPNRFSDPSAEGSLQQEGRFRWHGTGGDVTGKGE